MARSKTRIYTVGLVDSGFKSKDDMDWASIESKSKATFSTEQRAEIFACYQRFERLIIWHKNAADSKITEDLYNELSRYVNGIVSLSRKVNSDTEDRRLGIRVDPDRAASWNALTMEYPDILGSFKTLAAQARLIISQLGDKFEIEAMGTSRNPETEALEEFVFLVYQGAASQDARGSTPYARERQRWGISVGPESMVFRKFVNALLESSFTRHQIREAADAARKRLADGVTGV